MADYRAQCSSNQYIYLLLRTEVTSQDVAANTSTVAWTLRVTKSSSSTSATWGNCSYSATINGDSRSGSSNVSVSPGGETVVLGGSTVCGHNSDGSLTISVSASISGKIVGNVSGNLTLNTIPRASSLVYAAHPNGGPLMIGSPITFNAHSSSDRFTHSLTIEYGTYSTTIASYVSGNVNFGWTPPLDLCSQTPNATSGKATLRLYTWVGRGESSVGVESYVITLNVPSSVVPELTALNLAPVSDNSAIRDWGVYVKGYSKIKASAVAAGIYGSTISKITYSISGLSSASGGTEYQSPILNSSGTISVKAQAVDSRGRVSSSQEVAINVLDYAAPTLSQVSLYRSAEDGTASSTGAYIYAKAKMGISDIDGHNTGTMSVQYRAKNGSYSAAAPLEDNVGKTIGGALSLTLTYEATITLKDSVGETATVKVLIPTDSVSFHIKEGGNGAAFGKYAEESNLLDSAWPLRVAGNVSSDSLTVGGGTMADHVISAGSSGSWFFRKWLSGVAECWAQVNAQYANSSVLTRAVSLPFKFASVTSCTATLNNYNENAASALPWNCKVQFNTGAVHIAVHSTSGNFSSGTAMPVSVRVEGLWVSSEDESIVGTAVVGYAELDDGEVITADRLNAIESSNASTASKVANVKEAMS